MLLVILPRTAQAAPVSPAALVRDRTAYDGTVVELQGEAIGEALRANKGMVWINVMVEDTAIGVWTTPESAQAIGTWGDYRTSGDTVLVKGVFNLACAEHGGEMDVHAERLRVTDRGERVVRPLDWWKGALGVVAFGLAAVQGVVLVRLRRRVES